MIASSFIFFRCSHGRGDLLGCLDLGAARADDVESAGIAVFIHELVLDLDILRVDETGGTAEKTEQFRRGISLLDAVIESGDDVVAAGSLSAGKDHADAEGFIDVLVFSLHEGDERLAVGVLEKIFHFGLVGHGLGRLSCLDRDRLELGCENCGQLGRVLVARALQCG